MDSGAASPKETQLRLWVIGARYPRPRTQIPVRRADGRGMYYLDMGWEDIMLALEYDGGQHWDSPKRIAYDIERAEYLRDIGWGIVNVMKEHRRSDVLNRLARSWAKASR
jgi:very-short-patch-repair endonuclease